MTTFENVNPRLYGRSDDRIVTNDDRDEDVIDEFDSREIFGKFIMDYYLK